MSRVGNKVKRAYTKTGEHFVVYDPPGTPSGEYMSSELNAQATKPFIREFFLESSFFWDTEVNAGDVLVTDQNIHYLVMNLTPELVKNEIFQNNAVLYKCNVSGEFQRPSGELTYDDDQNVNINFETIYSGIYCCLTDNMANSNIEMNVEAPIGQIQLLSKHLYASQNVEVLPLDRFACSDGRIFKIEEIEFNRFDNVSLLWLVEDTR